MSGNILSFLGLALRGGRLAVGDEPAALAAKAGQSRLLVVASDASERTFRRGAARAEEGHCLWLSLPFTKQELGGALGRSSTAIAALTDTGLAAALTAKLAALDPERYGETAARMDLKRRRADERKTAPRRDPPKREERRPSEFRREGAARPAHKSGQRPGDRQDRRPWDRPRNGGGPSRPGGDRPHGGEPGRSRSGGPGRPYGGDKSRSGRPDRPHPGKSRSPGSPGKGRKDSRPMKNRGGPRSGGGRGPNGGTPAGRGH